MTETATPAPKKNKKKPRHQIYAGWPEHRHNLDPCIRPYDHYNSAVIYQDGQDGPSQGQQIIVPSTLRLEMRRILPPLQGNMGIEKNKILGQTFTLLAKHEYIHSR